ncbi:MAG: hypothetical protein KTR15_03495 [Phycisphaeraceae bacterium]|nr:hypothetical protein [Phycisphaeraceae bacterium]
MNETNPTPEEELAPLDPFEQQWIDQLAQREPGVVQSEDAFVQSVMSRHAQESAGPAVIGRIGQAVLPYAVAAAVLLVGFVGWVVLKDQITDEPSVVKEEADPSQPGEDPAVVITDRPKVELGKLIANVKSTATSPATSLTDTVSEAPETLNVGRLFDLLDGSVPDLKKILAPLEAKNEQSRA